MRSHRAHKAWLVVSALVIGGFGPVFALGSTEATSGAAAWTLDLLAWPVDGSQDLTAGTTRFLSALTGGFLLGWGVMVLALRSWVYDQAPEGVRRSLLAGALAWFVLDSLGSIASGTPSNAGFNVAVLLLVVGPLWWPATSRAAEPTGSLP
ncbi:hypothetical protein [Jannaschia sp. R86511]|uniref:hypothetical protein n=1 Tax=Jannaschia sp. R86511 TaxID=3093853 RepID=UPI0036D3ABE9